jgi:hypothetical protein
MLKLFEQYKEAMENTTCLVGHTHLGYKRSTDYLKIKFKKQKIGQMIKYQEQSVPRSENNHIVL